MNDTAFLEDRIGTTLKGKWTLERLLGSGGMAAVYVGVHTIGRRHAIKILHPEVAASPEVRARFEQEAHAVNLLHHPGAVEIHDFDVSEDGCPFLVMELLEGETLAQRLMREKQYDLRELLSVADQTLEVLVDAHAQGIVHRDIKPANLFLLPDGGVKVLDFGVARMLEGTKVQTKLGTALGTPTYMPPEQARGEAIDGRADIFALGGTLFRAITRQRIHRCESDADLLVKMATVPAPPLATVARHVSEDVCLVVDRALAFHRDQRYPHARVMQLDVRALLGGKTPPYASKRAQDDPLPIPLVHPAGTSQLASTVEREPADPVSQVPASRTIPSDPPPGCEGGMPVSGGPFPSQPPSGRLSGPDDPTSAQTPDAKAPSWPVPQTLTDMASAPPPACASSAPPPGNVAATAPMQPLAPTAPMAPMAPAAPAAPASPTAALMPQQPAPASSGRPLVWIALLLAAVLMLLVGGTLGGLYVFRSGGVLDQMEAK